MRPSFMPASASDISASEVLVADEYRVVYSSDAADELQAIFRYIERDSPQNAPRMIGKIFDAIESLGVFPQRYRDARNLGPLADDIRSMPVWPYLVRYKIDEAKKSVEVVSIRHGARRPGL